MKKLSVLLCIFLLSACAPSEVPSDKLVERNGIVYEINSQTPFAGVATVHHENGQLESKSTYEDGKLNGITEDYRENGQLETKATYKDGKLHGLYEVHYSDGTKRIASLCYQNGEDADISKCK